MESEKNSVTTTDYCKMGNKIEIVENSCRQRTTEVIKSQITGLPSSDIELRNEIVPFSSVFIAELESEKAIYSLNDEKNKMELKQELCLLERTLIEKKIKSEDSYRSDIHIKREIPSSDFIECNSSSNVHRIDHKIGIKVEIKEETSWLERTTTEITSESEEVHANLQYETKDNISRMVDPDKEILSTELTRLYTKPVRNLDSGIISSCLDNKDCLRPGENTCCQEKTSTYSANGSGIEEATCLDDKEPYKCKICEKNFTWLSSFKRHNRLHEGKKPYTCKLCGKCFTLASYLKTHSLIHEGSKLHKCKICDKSFTRASYLKIHNVAHEGKRIYKYQCKICDKSFTTATYLKRHNMFHECIRPYKCKFCDKCFTFESHLKRHHLIHEGKRLHKCKICNRNFSRASRLKEHNLIHEGENSYKCKICEKCFTTASHLKTHCLIHEGGSPHKCKVCERSFTTASHLKTHNLIHEGKRPHHCGICGKSFIRASHLKTHTLIHEGTRAHKCIICEKSFRRAYDLNRHLTVHRKRSATSIKSC